MADITALGATILHSLWQATLLALILWGISRRKGLTSVFRYRLAYGTLLLQVGLSVLTFLHYHTPAHRLEESIKLVMIEWVSAGSVATAASPSYSDSTFWMTALVACWLLSVVLGAARLSVSFGRVRRMQYLSEPITRYEAAHGSSGLVDYVSTLATRIGYRGRVRLRVGQGVSSPVLLGHLKPILLLPVAIINQLSTEEAETVILHELAHLRRYDHLFNLLQCLIEVLFYYHPAIHWIGARIREEREYCCDDLVLAYGPGRLPYARALLYYGEQAAANPATALSLTDGGGLLVRVRRFIDNYQTTYTMKKKFLFLPLLAFTVLISTAAYAPLAESTKPAPLLSEEMAPALPALMDTLPDGKHEVTKISNGKVTRLRVEGGEIKELTIEDEAISPAEYDDYERTAEALLDDQPAGWHFDFSPLELHRLADSALRSVNMDSIMQEVQAARATMQILKPDSLLRIAEAELERIDMDSLMHLQEAALREMEADLSLISDSLSLYMSNLTSLSAIEQQERQLERQLEYLREQKKELQRQEKRDR